MTPLAVRCAGVTAACVLAGCGGMQSALDPAGNEAADIVRLSRWLFTGAVVIWLGVMALAAWAAHARPPAVSGDARDGARTDAEERHETRHARRVIFAGGVVLPVVTLAGLLVYALRMTPPLLAADGDLTILVTGEQWWWRVRYLPPGGPVVDSANEVRVPAGGRVTFRLLAADVIHSFWIPALGGKIDMIPGQVNRLTVEPRETGRYRGVCAEFCGIAHALMAFDVVVMEDAAFADWLRKQAAPASAPQTSAAREGQRLFLDNGCGACHRIAGTAAIGVVGPDLSHVGSRLTIGAGTLPADEARIAAWISAPASFKPGVEMPSYHMLGGDELAAISTYLRGLR